MKHSVFVMLLGIGLMISPRVFAQETDAGDIGDEIKSNAETAATAVESDAPEAEKADNPDGDEAAAPNDVPEKKDEKAITKAPEKDAPSTATQENTSPKEKAEKKPESAGPPAAQALLSLQPAMPFTVQSLKEYDRQYRRNRLMQSMGKSMMAASFAMEIIGAIVIEAAPYGPIAWSAFGVVGAGIVHFIASAFLLAFSKPPHHLIPPRREVAVLKGSGDILFM